MWVRGYLEAPVMCVCVCPSVCIVPTLCDRDTVNWLKLTDHLSVIDWTGLFDEFSWSEATPPPGQRDVLFITTAVCFLMSVMDDSFKSPDDWTVRMKRKIQYLWMFPPHFCNVSSHTFTPEQRSQVDTKIRKDALRNNSHLISSHRISVGFTPCDNIINKMVFGWRGLCVRTHGGEDKLPSLLQIKHSLENVRFPS